jgi:hypothetical protein
MRGRSLRTVGAVLLVLACCLMLAAEGLGSTRADRVTLTSNGQIATATAHCPGNQRATGGGFSASPPPSGSTTMQVFASRKIGQHAWQAAVELQTSAPAEMTFTAYVYCAKHAPMTKSNSHSVPILSGVSNFVDSDAACTWGRARAGGFSLSTPDYDGSLVASQRHGRRGWRTRIDGDHVTVTTYAYCASGRAPKARSGTAGSIGTEFKAATSEPCPGGRAPLSGGFGQPDAITGFVGNGFRDFVPYESKRSSKRWQSSGEHRGGTTSHVVAIAYCGS